ncbi:NAD(+) diphosphatase [Clostridium estertheticum]|uniref:NAD(+) diphosphatase n=2 Tax=Clostridium estertheticum TaxID=238834 RepID=A0A1J0GBC1_9CLOT|nr:NUDIX domain-containing protein [Clostridium estertheticum]APC38652.1 DNA mismatch repair protein MutT [Clostridium estertheticum subsp. estertheticum]MBU3174656.1 NUDIX domain-containing protein [Clostridium estertheticum]MBU3218351.1 NUDIX domain-containing protein [Clostridium estertheticum]MBW9174004.1 NUDIX domain-containing protein [Clostridium estertheticum]MBX4267575.1 NUDIX domain-containing protein [Clostridium estertheticum]
MRFIYCPICGTKLIEKDSWDEGAVPYCPVDDNMYFDTPKPCVVVAVMKGKEILLLKQNYTFKNSKVLVSGYVTNGESVEETVYREVKEETGITVGKIKYLGSDYLASKEIIMLTFMAKFVEGNIKKSPEVDWADWVNIDDAICEMSEDEIGKRVVRKLLKEINYTGEKAYRCDIK